MRKSRFPAEYNNTSYPINFFVEIGGKFKFQVQCHGDGGGVAAVAAAAGIGAVGGLGGLNGNGGGGGGGSGKTKIRYVFVFDKVRLFVQ